MAYKLKKTDIAIITVLIIIAAAVLLKTEIVKPPITPHTPEIEFYQDDGEDILRVISVSTETLWKDIQINGKCDRSGLSEYVVEGNELKDCEDTIILVYLPTGDTLGSFTFIPEEIPPESIVLGRVITPADQGKHYDSLIVNREWWYYTAIFSEDSELSGYSLSVSFNHMGRNDLYLTKPDLLFVTLHGPNGEEYGGIVEKERPLLGDLSPLKKPVLQVSSSDDMVRVTYEKSYIQGLEPNWHIHIEGDDIDENHDLEIDLQIFAPSAPIWTHSNRPIQNSNAKIATYMFMGCEVDGTVSIDGFEYIVKGSGHHEHTWASGLLTKSLIKGWDWSHMTLENGWNIYYSNYYLASQYKSSKETSITPFSTCIVTTDQGKKITILDNVDIKITKSEKVFVLLNIPVQTNIVADTSPSQVFLQSSDISLNLQINSENTLDKSWKRLSYVGMKIGQSTITGKISWDDDNGEHNIDLNGVGTIWNMRH